MAVERDLNTIAFPILTEEQMAQLGRYAGAPPKKFRPGEALFRAGDRDAKFFVVKSGKIEIVDVTGDQPKTIRVIGPGEFTGDVGHLTGNPKVVSAIAQSNCEAYEISWRRTACFSRGLISKVIRWSQKRSSNSELAKRTRPSLRARIVCFCAIHRTASWRKQSGFAGR